MSHNKQTSDAPTSATLAELAEYLGGQLVSPADGPTAISGVADLDTAQVGQISFVSDKTYLPKLAASAASAVVIAKDLAVDRPAIVVDRPDLAFAALLERFAPPLPHPVGVHPSAIVDGTLAAGVGIGPNVVIGAGSTVGERTVIHANVTIGPNVTIGADCVLWPGVVIRERCRIGDRVTIHPNATLGADGFGYNLVAGTYKKIPHIGIVVIENDVEIGAGACIDRAKAGATVIGTGTKVDNLVQIGHNVRIGANVILVAQVGIAGSTTLGQYVVLGGKVGVRDHVNIGDKVQVAACSCISKDIDAGQVVGGTPAQDVREFYRQQAQVRRLPELTGKVSELAKQVHELKQAIHDLQAG